MRVVGHFRVGGGGTVGVFLGNKLVSITKSITTQKPRGAHHTRFWGALEPRGSAAQRLWEQLQVAPAGE